MKFRILIFFLQFSVFGFSQEIPPVSRVMDSLTLSSPGLSADSLLRQNPSSDNSIFPKNFEENFQSKYKGPEFDYTTVKPRESLWQRIQKRLFKFIQSILGDVDPTKTGKYAEMIMRLFAIVIIGGVLYFLVKFLLNKDGNYFFGKKNKKITIADQDLNENIHEINFNETIQNFEQKKEYRAAIRYQFLFILKNLADQKLIVWNAEKTNKDYLAEIRKATLQSSFKELIYIFDYVWYGEFEVDETSYRYYKQKFVNFKTAL